jgi:hypothetical protein
MQPDGERLAPANYSKLADGFSSGWLFPHAGFSPVIPDVSKDAGAPTHSRNFESITGKSRGSGRFRQR